MQLFCVLISNIFSPINQISFGISNLLSNNSTMYKSAPVKQISYSSIAKKEPLQPVKTQNNIPRPPLPRASSINKVDNKKAVSCKATETAISAGYRFKARNPEPDPRYPADQQLMVGPITMGSRTEDHDVFYQGFRSFLNRYGAVAFMYIHQV